MNEVLTFLGVVINVWVFIYSCAEISDNKINYKNIWFWAFLLIISLFIHFASGNINGFIRIVITYIMLTTLMVIVFKVVLIKSLLVSLSSLSLMMISELLVVLFVTYVLDINTNDIHSDIFRLNIISIAISVTQCFLLSFNVVKQLIKRLILKINMKNTIMISVFSIFTVLIVIILTYYIYFEVSGVLAVVMALILMISYFVLIFTIFKEQNDRIKLINEYSILLDNLREYERMYSRERLQSHENKNDLMIIRGMVKDKNIIHYIDKLLNFQDQQNNNKFIFLSKLPSGGLRGLLYCKLCQMEENNISISLEINKKFDSTIFSFMSFDLQAKTCKLLGIFIDNSIEAIKNIDNKNISILINSKDNQLMFKIINAYDKLKDVDKIYEKGYTTKKKGHGYGLAIAKDIIDSEEKIVHTTMILGNAFCQQIIIKL